VSTKIPVYVNAWNALTPLGDNVVTLFDNMLAGKTSCKPQINKELYPELFCASIFESPYLLTDNFSKLETLIIKCLDNIISKKIASTEKTVFIFSSTKGNIDLLDADPIPAEQTFLWHTANKIAQHYGNPNKPITISNACVSGIMAQNLGFDLLRSGQYEHAVVFGADLVSSFVLSGFGSFKAMSPEPSKPFDEKRTGINLGEGAGAVILSVHPNEFPVQLTGTGSGNDANHISGPSRTGEGLSVAVNAALKESGRTGSDMDYVSAHGTATSYNDEMESLAFNDTGLKNVPLNSLKGYFGHTLGAAGLIETAVLLESMKRQTLLPSLGYGEHGVTGELNVITETVRAPISKAIKTGSGFGGCNAASVFEIDSWRRDASRQPLKIW
jgi:3-oxoacyl-[acyl-carrier-protein] synthase-1